MRINRESLRRQPWLHIENGRAPKIMSGLFWCAMLVAVVSILASFGSFGRETASATAPAMNAIFVVAAAIASVIWPFLRWSAECGTGRKWLSAAFVSVASVVMPIGGWQGVALMAVVVIHVVFVFGWGIAVAYTGVITMNAFFVSWLNYGGPAVGVVEALVAAIISVWALMVGNLMLSEQRQTGETRRLLLEQEQAHIELRRYASRVKELTVSEERARMSREMHDSVGHYLTVISLGLHNAQRYHEAGISDPWAEIRQAQELTQEALAETRRWVKALRPLALDDAAGVDAMVALAHSFNDFGVSVSFEVGADLSTLEADAELVIYRVLQEGLTNVVRHAQARSVEVELTRSANWIELTMTDDGRGRASSETVEDGHGLSGLRQRALALDGELSTAAAATGGFVLRLRLPSARAAAVSGV